MSEDKKVKTAPQQPTVQSKKGSNPFASKGNFKAPGSAFSGYRKSVQTHRKTGGR